MGENWRIVSLGEVVSLQRGHDLPADSRRSGAVPIIGSFGITGYHDLARYCGPGVAIGRSGASIGVATWCPHDYWPLNTCLFVKDFHGNDPRWVYYLLDSIDFMGFNSGSAQPSLNRNYLVNIPIFLPPFSEQRAIAEVLGALDDKIEANRRTQASAESLARMLVAQARAEADLILSIGALVDRVTTILQPADIPVDATYVALEHMSRGSLFLSEFGTPEAVASAKATFRPKDILFGKLRPYFKKVAVAPSDGVCSTDILVLSAKSGDWAVASAVCASDEVIDYATAGSEGTRMPRVSWDYLSRLELPMPDYDQRIALQAEVAPLLELGMALSSEARRLVALRDALLPELLSGELRVRDAEQLVEEVV